MPENNLYTYKDCCELLGLSATTNLTEADFKKAYRRKALEFHPDKYSGSPETFVIISSVYEFLMARAFKPFSGTFDRINTKASRVEDVINDRDIALAFARSGDVSALSYLIGTLSEQDVSVLVSQSSDPRIFATMNQVFWDALSKNTFPVIQSMVRAGFVLNSAFDAARSGALDNLIYLIRASYVKEGDLKLLYREAERQNLTTIPNAFIQTVWRALYQNATTAVHALVTSGAVPKNIFIDQVMTLQNSYPIDLLHTYRSLFTNDDIHSMAEKAIKTNNINFIRYLINVQDPASYSAYTGASTQSTYVTTAEIARLIVQTNNPQIIISSLTCGCISGTEFIIQALRQNNYQLIQALLLTQTATVNFMLGMKLLITTDEIAIATTTVAATSDQGVSVIQRALVNGITNKEDIIRVVLRANNSSEKLAKIRLLDTLLLEKMITPAELVISAIQQHAYSHIASLISKGSLTGKDVALIILQKNHLTTIADLLKQKIISSADIIPVALQLARQRNNIGTILALREIDRILFFLILKEAGNDTSVEGKKIFNDLTEAQEQEWQAWQKQQGYSNGIKSFGEAPSIHNALPGLSSPTSIWDTTDTFFPADDLPLVNAQSANRQNEEENSFRWPLKELSNVSTIQPDNEPSISHRDAPSSNEFNQAEISTTNNTKPALSEIKPILPVIIKLDSAPFSAAKSNTNKPTSSTAVMMHGLSAKEPALNEKPKKLSRVKKLKQWARYLFGLPSKSKIVPEAAAPPIDKANASQDSIKKKFRR